MKTDQFVSKIEMLYRESKLPHLFIIKIDLANAEDFYQKMIETITHKKLSGHADFYKVNVDESEKSYKVDSKNIADFSKFLNFKPTHIKHKFAFVFDAHLMTEVLYNKFLKTFEETSSDTTIFLIIPKEEELLPTIKSRAITFYLDQDKTLIETEILDPALILLNFKNQEMSFENAFEQLINFNLKNTNRSPQDILDAIKLASKAQQFNNSKPQILSFLMP
jgi:DNA polymerase III delta prime subunit